MTEMTNLIIKIKSKEVFSPDQPKLSITESLSIQNRIAPDTPEPETNAVQQVEDPGILGWWDAFGAQLLTYLRPRIFGLWLLWHVYSLSALLICLLAFLIYARRHH